MKKYFVFTLSLIAAQNLLAYIPPHLNCTAKEKNEIAGRVNAELKPIEPSQKKLSIKRGVFMFESSGRRIDLKETEFSNVRKDKNGKYTFDFVVVTFGVKYGKIVKLTAVDCTLYQASSGE